MPTEQQKQWNSKAKEAAKAAPLVRLAARQKLLLTDTLANVAREAADATLRAGGAITKVKAQFANRTKQAANAVKRGKNWVKEHYFKASQVTWSKLEVQFAVMSMVCGGIEKRTCMLLESMRRSIRPVRGERILRRLFPRDIVKRIYECDLLRPWFMKEGAKWEVHDTSLFNHVRIGARVTLAGITASSKKRPI